MFKCRNTQLDVAKYLCMYIMNIIMNIYISLRLRTQLCHVPANDTVLIGIAVAVATELVYFQINISYSRFCIYYLILQNIFDLRYFGA